jgi:hypothetical protein
MTATNLVWLHCTPMLLNMGVDCATTPRRDGTGGVGHEHLVAVPVLQVQAPTLHDADECEVREALARVLESDFHEVKGGRSESPGWTVYYHLVRYIVGRTTIHDSVVTRILSSIARDLTRGCTRGHR